jgi:hypothetical protein
VAAPEKMVFFQTVFRQTSITYSSNMSVTKGFPL